MTQDRAKYILKNQNKIGQLRFAFDSQFKNDEIFEDGITKKEDFYIRTIWQTMTINNSYFDAVLKIAGELSDN